MWKVNLNMVTWDPMWKHENMYPGTDMSKYLVFFGLKSYNAVCDLAPSYMPPLVPTAGGVSMVLPLPILFDKPSGAN